MRVASWIIGLTVCGVAVLLTPAALDSSRLVAAWSTNPGGIVLPSTIYPLTDFTLGPRGTLLLGGVTHAPAFPTTRGAVDRTCGTDGDAAVMVYSPSGGLRYSTCLGGPTTEQAARVVSSDDGILWVATNSAPKIYGPGAGGRWDEFHAKLWRIKPGLVSFQQAWSIGGPETRATVVDLAVAHDGSVWVTGDAFTADLPTVNAWQPVFGGAGDIFLAHYAPGRSEPLAMTYIGGPGWDRAGALAVAPDGDVVLLGYTTSPDFPLVRPLQPRHGGVSDVLLIRFDASGRWVEFSTFLGGSSEEHSCQLAIDGAGNALVVGNTPSPDFPSTEPSVPRKWSSDLFLVSVNAVGELGTSTLIDSGTAVIPARDVGASALHLSARGDGSLLVVGRWGSDDLLRWGGFLTLTDRTGTPVVPPELIELPTRSFLVAATADASRVFVVELESSEPFGILTVVALPIGNARR